MFGKVLAGSVLGIGVFATSAASAADFAPPLIQDNWSGFYVGAHAGAVDSHTTIRDEYFSIFDAEGGTLFTNDLSGMAGLHGGYNWQWGAGMFGIEVDYSWTDAGRNRAFDNDDNIANSDIDGFGSVRGRAGLAVDNALVYVTGGLGFVDATVFGSDNGVPDEEVETEDFLAFVAGAGAEFKLQPNLSARLEYLHYFFSDETDTCGNCNEQQVFGGGLNVLRAGVSYHFAAAPDGYVEPDGGGGNGWSGFYAGGHVGAADTSTGVHDEARDVTLTEGVSMFTNGLDFAGGIHAGYNYAIRSAVIGIEADYTFTDSGFSRSMNIGEIFLSSQIDGIASIRARLGLAAGNAHAYVTGGVAYVNGDIVASDDLADPDRTVSYDGFLALVSGAGVEAMVAPNVSVRGEYLFYTFDEKSEVCGDCGVDAVPADGEIHMARVGASYHFNGAGAPAGHTGAADWSGFYLGGHAGLVDTTVGVRDERGILFGDRGTTSFVTTQDFGGGLHGGYNLQWGNAVAGIEVDYTFTDAGDNQEIDNNSSFNNTRIDGFGSVRGRLGLAAGDALFYATGGVGWIDADVEAGRVTDPDRRGRYDDFIALVAGVGAEYRIGENMSLRGEYLYFGFDEKSDLCVDCGADAAYADGELHIFRGGISYHFN